MNTKDLFQSIRTEHDLILKQLSDPALISDWEKLEELTKKKIRMEKMIEKMEEIKESENMINENQLIIAADEDQELTSLAETEIGQLKTKKAELEKELDDLIKNEKKTDDPKAIVIEIRGGAGGEEAALFAADLFRMYDKFSKIMGWKQKTLELNRTEIGGLKEAIFELKGDDVWRRMKYEAGVHRIQRIPITEKSGRIHTSTATVAVLPKTEKSDFKIKTDDIKIDFFCSSGPGGQYVNKRQSAVRITHLPTGLVVASQTERNQLANRTNAMAILEYRLQELKEKEEEAKIGGERRTQIGGAKRSEKIRTYNFPQDRVTDHRIKKNWHNIEEILNGNLGRLTDDLIKDLEQPQ